MHNDYIFDLTKYRERLLQFITCSFHGKVTNVDIHVFSVSPDIKQLSMLLSFSFCGIFSFEQVGVTFRHETLMGSELPQYAARLDHFLKAAEQRFLRLSCMQSYLKRHIEPSFFLIANINKAKGTGESWSDLLQLTCSRREHK
jgi:hypothetical protein